THKILIEYFLTDEGFANNYHGTKMLYKNLLAAILENIIGLYFLKVVLPNSTIKSDTTNNHIVTRNKNIFTPCSFID
ncbi:MAG: hypothetical protein ACOVMR_04775, partial [Flavobacteriales bacterium]